MPALLSLKGCFPNCNEDSEAVSYARSLTQERLEKLYYDMERLSNDESIPAFGYRRKDGENLPEPFEDLKVVKIRPREGNIMIEGCFDHYVFLYFKGYDKRSKFETEKRIVLSWGEREPQAGTQVLWKEDKIEPIGGANGFPLRGKP